MTSPQIILHTPAPSDAADTLHRNLVAAGQTLDAENMPSFLMSVTDDAGTRVAGCKGEIAFQTAHISELWVSAALRGQGIGTALLARADDHARAQGCTRIQIETRNPKARALYEAHGYTTFGEVPHYEGANSLCYLIKALPPAD